MTARSERGNGRRLALALIVALAIHAGLAVVPLSFLVARPTVTGPIEVDLQAAPLQEQIEPAPPETTAPESAGPAGESGVAVQTQVPAVRAPSAPKSTHPAPAQGEPAALPKGPGKAEGFSIPQPKQPAPPAAGGGGPVGPAFREVGGLAGKSGGAPAAVPSPGAAAPALAPITTDSAGAASGGASAAPAKGVGVAVQGKTTQGGKLDLGSLDTALAGAGAGTGAAGALPRGGGGTSAAGSGGTATGTGGQGGFSITWDRPAAGRERRLLSAPKPKIPAWVGTQGLTLRVVVSFSVSPEGVVSQPRLDKSCGYSDVDAAVVEAVRLWRFSADQTAATIRGQVPYEIRAR